MLDKSVNIALTIGDPVGIGPEIAADLMNRGKFDGFNSYVIGSAEAFVKNLSPDAAGKINIVSDWNLIPERKSSLVSVIDTASGIVPPPGRASEESGKISGKAVEIAISMALSGKIEGIVTGPISKEALALAGYSYIGHTDMLQDKFDSPDCQMVMVNGNSRIVIMTRDIPLKEVPGAVTARRIKECVRVTDKALKELWEIKAPKIVVAALNPHAGDGGVTGSEEIDVIIPAIKELSESGLDVTGPVPSDTLFYDRESQPYDAYVALYHDQGMIPFKIMGFDNGVNMTIGLPVVRTSVCHGTAYEIAGRGEAESGSLQTAVSMAVKCCTAKRRNVGV